jgi:uncharacterized protein (TIGR03437 family)
VAIHRILRTVRAIGIWLVLSFLANAQFTPAPNPFPAGSAPVSVVVGNFTGNSIPSIAVANQLGTVTVLPGNGTGGFTPGVTSPVAMPPGMLLTAMAAGDLNKKGIQDLVITTASSTGLDGNAIVLLNNGSGGFTVQGTPFQAGKNPSCVVVKDLNGDGFLDIAIANRDSNNVTVLMGSSTGFTAAPGSPYPVGNNPSSLAAGDFNADSYLDLAVANESDNTVTVLLGTPTGSFRQATASPFAVGYNPYSLVVADFNGDGNLDFATANLSSGNVTVLLGNGTGGFTPASASPSIQGTKPVSMVVGDFNGDYIPDLAIVGLGSSNLTVLLGTGAGGFKTGPGSPYVLAGDPTSVAIGDFNGDGVPDLVIANLAADNVTVLLNTFTTTPVMVSAASYSTAGPVAPGSLVSIFGTDSAAMPAAGAMTKCLQGIQVMLTDFSGVKMPLSLFYVTPTQSYPGPAQINALIPATAATGSANFTILLSAPTSQTSCGDVQTGIAQKGSVTLAAVAPSLFSANGTGKGVAAAVVFDLVSNQSAFVFTCPPKQPCGTDPLLNVADGSSILELFGTGIQNRAKLSDVTVTIGSQTLSVLYAGPAGYPGEDQVNVALPASLAKSGTVYVTVSIAGATSNQVTLYIQ